MDNSLTVNRTCGDCIACCSYLKIGELEKPGLHHCKFATLKDPEEEGMLQYTGATEKNCSVYGTDKQPECCRGYVCAWLAGHGIDEDRPDKSLMLFDCLNNIQNGLEAKPLDEGVEDTPAGRGIIERLSRSTDMAVLVLSFYEKQLKRVVGRGI